MAHSTSSHGALSYLGYPLLLVLPLAVWGYLWKVLGWDPSLALQLVYICNIVVIVGLEFLFPFEKAWLKNDGQVINDIVISASALVLNSLFTVLLLGAFAWAIEHFSYLVSLNVWPVHWPFTVQLVLGVLVWDLGNHLAHRWGHLVPLLWRFHSVHHAAPRLSALNTGRLHPLNVLVSVMLGAPLPLLLGVPVEISLCYAAFNVFVGTLTHANLNLNCGPFNYVLSTPCVHRWHHSPHAVETDTNYGETTLVWDHLFGTFFYPADRRPHRNVGLGPNVRMSRNLWHQIVDPMLPRGHCAPDDKLMRYLPVGEAGPERVAAPPPQVSAIPRNG